MGHQAYLPDNRQTLLRPEPHPDRQPLYRRVVDIESPAARWPQPPSRVACPNPDDDVLVEDLESDDDLLATGAPRIRSSTTIFWKTTPTTPSRSTIWPTCAGDQEDVWTGGALLQREDFSPCRPRYLPRYPASSPWRAKASNGRLPRWGHSSDGRALEWHSRGRGFDPAWLHQRDLKNRAVFTALFLVVPVDRHPFQAWSRPLLALAFPGSQPTETLHARLHNEARAQGPR